MNNLQNKVSSPAKNAWDAWEMLTLEPLHANDPRYLDCSAARGIDVVQKLHTAIRLHSRANKCMHQLFTGYRGDGKTTELYRFIGLIENEYRPLYFNAEEEFDLNDFRFPDFLLGIATVVFERMNEQQLRLPNDLLEKVANWFAKIVEIVERKTSAELQAEEKINKNITQRAINELCETYQKAVEEADYENLIETYKTKEVRNDERTQLLIYNTAILVYDENGLEWYDVHPALANGKKFKKLLQGS